MSGSNMLHEQIAAIFAEEMNLEVPSVDADLFESAALDSMAFVDLVLHLERKFGLKISLEDLELDNFRTIARIAEFVANRDGTTGGPTRR